MTGGQSKRSSWHEAWVNIAVGYSVNFVANLVVFPLFGYNVTVKDNLVIGVIYTFISLARSYAIRRWFNKKLVTAEKLPYDREYRKFVKEVLPKPEHEKPPFMRNP